MASRNNTNDDNKLSSSQQRPPAQGVFNSLGVMELEHRFNITHGGGSSSTPDSELGPDSYSIDNGSSDDDDNELAFSDNVYDGSAGGFLDNAACCVIDNLPIFNTRGKFTEYENRVIDQEVQDLSPPSGSVVNYDSASTRNNRKKKRYCVGMAVLLATVSVALTVFLTGGQRHQQQEEVEGEGNKNGNVRPHVGSSSSSSTTQQGHDLERDTTHESQASLQPNEDNSDKFEHEKEIIDTFVQDELAVATSSSTTTTSSNNKNKYDFSKYGYRNVQVTSLEWLSWPQTEDTTSFKSYTIDDGITSPTECAAKCGTMEAHAGAWSTRFQACWCNLVGGVNTLCKEPCVEEEYVEFSTVPFDDFDYCKESVCSNDWYHSDEYCFVDIQFDKDDCTAKLQVIESTPDKKPKPTNNNEIDLISQQVAAAAAAAASDDSGENVIMMIKPAAMSTAKRYMPDSKKGGLVHLSVEHTPDKSYSTSSSSHHDNGTERMSYIRFELPSSSNDSSRHITRATLQLYLTNHHQEYDTNDIFTVKIEALPNPGKWHTVTWNNKLDEGNKIEVVSFPIAKSYPGERKKLYEVDVTSAIISNDDMDRVTFKLSTMTVGRLDFGGKTWSNGNSTPKLMLTMSQ